MLKWKNLAEKLLKMSKKNIDLSLSDFKFIIDFISTGS